MQNFKIERTKNSAVVKFNGEQFMDDILSQKDQIAKIIDNIQEVELVFNKNTRFHAAQMQLIVALAKELQTKGKKIRVKGLKNKSVRKQFEIAGCIHFLESLTSN